MGVLGVVETAWRAIRGDFAARYLLAERMSERLHHDAVLADSGRTWLRDQDFRSIYRSFEPDHRRRMERVWFLRELARRAATQDAATAECGVFNGLSSYVIASENGGVAHHVFDSFEGLSEPGPRDGDHWSAGDLSASLDEVRSRLAALQNVEYHAGWIPVRFPDVSESRFSLVHIDVDLAEPTHEALEFFGPRMIAGGVMVIDDYGFDVCPGARRVTDEYALKAGMPVIEAPTGQGVILY